MGIIERVGRRVDAAFQRWLTPKEERARLESDLVRQDIAAQDRELFEEGGDRVESLLPITPGTDASDTLARIGLEQLRKGEPDRNKQK